MATLESSEVIAHKYRVNAAAMFLNNFQMEVAQRRLLKIGVKNTGLYDVPELKQRALELLADLDRVG